MLQYKLLGVHLLYLCGASILVICLRLVWFGEFLYDSRTIWLRFKCDAKLSEGGRRLPPLEVRGLSKAFKRPFGGVLQGQRLSKGLLKVFCRPCRDRGATNHLSTSPFPPWLARSASVLFL